MEGLKLGVKELGVHVGTGGNLLLRLTVITNVLRLSIISSPPADRCNFLVATRLKTRHILWETKANHFSFSLFPDLNNRPLQHVSLSDLPTDPCHTVSSWTSRHRVPLWKS
ncbi:hypothetical protein Q5P01_001080 [Channa striata]|uniref:Uncharacterized protein n=1 Tax=Channa striata TaxID=64152 RepID=A0AA88NK45_CHASR|nr:hypothetical protein Q5P01_001080 [Channa striata]